jgi:hypothetical protein
MYVRGYLQGSENGRVVTIANKTAIINHHVYNLPVKKNGGSHKTLIVTSFNMKNLVIIN